MTAPLRIAVLTQNAANYSVRRLIEAARARGHAVEALETTRCWLQVDARRPQVMYAGAPLPQFDVVIPRIGAPLTAYGVAVVRHFELTGAWCLNGAAAIAAARDKLHALQILAGAGVALPTTAFARSPQDAPHVLDAVGGAPAVVKLLSGTQGRGVVLAETDAAAAALLAAFADLEAEILLQAFVAEADGADLRCLVVGGEVVAAMKRQAAPGEFRSNLHLGGAASAVATTAQERALAVRAVRALGLEVGGVDILRAHDGPQVIEVNASPGLEGIEAVSGVDVAGRMIRWAERSVRPRATGAAA